MTSKVFLYFLVAMECVASLMVCGFYNLIKPFAHSAVVAVSAGSIGLSKM